MRSCSACGKAMRRIPICGNCPDGEVKALAKRHGGVIWLGCTDVGGTGEWGWHCPACGKTEYEGEGGKWHEYTDRINPWA